MNAFTTFLQADWAELMGWTLLHSLWQIALVAAVYAIVSLLLRNRSADARYVIGCVALLLMLGFPIGTYVLLSQESTPASTDVSNIRAVAELPVEAIVPPDNLTQSDTATADPLLPIAPPNPARSGVVSTEPAGASAESVITDRLSALRRWLPWATATWLIGVLLLSLRPLWGGLHVRRLQRHGLSPLSDTLQQVAERLMRRLGVKQAVRFAQSALLEVPAVVGYLRPMVLLPASAITGLSAAEIELILAHELAHIRRHDCLVNVAQAAIETLLFYHPGMWWISGQIRKERENCCDDIAVALGDNRANYVRALVRLEEQRSATSAAVLAATGQSLLARVRRLLGQPTRELGYGNATAWLAGLATLGFVALLVAGFATAGAERPSTIRREIDGEQVETKTAQSAGQPASDSTKAPGWDERRIAGYPIVRGRVIDATGEPVSGADVGRRWNVYQGDMNPGAWVVTDSQGRFEIPTVYRHSPVVVMALDEARQNGGLVVVDKPDDESEGDVDVEIKFSPLVEVRGSYWAPAAGRRPRKVWTSVELLPQEVHIVESTDRSPYFSFRLPEGTYRLRGNMEDFDDVYRTLELKAGQQPVELTDMEMPVSKRGSLYGKPAPAWHFTEAQGMETSAKISDYRGKWLVIEFWGAWCGPCISQMDQLFRFSDKHEDDRDRFEIITVHHSLENSTDDLPTKMPQLLKRWEIDAFPYPVAIDSTNQTIERFGVKGFPTTIFIDPAGQVTKVPGIWGLSKILKGRGSQQVDLFMANESPQQHRPPRITPSNPGGGVRCDQYVALGGHEDEAWAVSFLPSGKEFVTAGADNMIRFWDVASREQTRVIRCTPRGKSISSYGGIQVFVSQDGKFVGGLYYAFRDEGVLSFPRLWRSESDYETFISLMDPTIHFGYATLSRDARRVAVFAYHPESKSQYVRIYDLEKGTLLKVLDVHGDRRADTGSSSAIEFSPDGCYLAVSGDKGRSIQIWDVESGRMKWEKHPKDVNGISSISFSPDGGSFAMATGHEPLDIRDTSTGKLIRTLRKSGHQPGDVAISPDGKYVATAGWGSRPAIRIWSHQSGEIIGTLVGHPTGVRSQDLAWSPDSRYLVTVAGAAMRKPGEVLLWDLVAGGIVTRD